MSQKFRITDTLSLETGLSFTKKETGNLFQFVSSEEWYGNMNNSAKKDKKQFQLVKYYQKSCL